MIEEFTLSAKVQALCDTVDGLRREVELGREHTSFLYGLVEDLLRATNALKEHIK